MSDADEPMDEPTTAGPEPPPTRPRRRRRPSTGQAIGGAIVGFDYQVFRATKPPAELVEHAAPVRGLSAADGGRLTIGLPDDEPVDPEADRPSDDPPTVASSDGLR